MKKIIAILDKKRKEVAVWIYSKLLSNKDIIEESAISFSVGLVLLLIQHYLL